MTSKPRRKDEFRDIEIDKINPPQKQDRLTIDQTEIEELAKSIDEVGLLSPIEVQIRADGYEIVFGHRRWLAHKILKKKTIKARVIELDDEVIKIRRATENIGRANLTALEEGLIYIDLQESFNLKPDQIANRCGKGVSRVKRHIALTRMPIKIRDAVHTKKISIGVAEELWRCADDGQRDYLLDLCIDHGVTVMVVRQWVSDYNKESRRTETDIGEGGGVYNQFEPQPTYYPCDICNGPEDITKQKLMRLCVTCYKKLMELVRE